MYQQVLNLRKGVGHPFVEPQLGVGDDGVLTGNFLRRLELLFQTAPMSPEPPPPR